MAERIASRYWSSDYITSTLKKKKLVHVKAWKCFGHRDIGNCVKGPERQWSCANTSLPREY